MGRKRKDISEDLSADIKPYKGNENLPVASKFLWTPEMVTSLEKCKNDIFEFSKHFWIVNLDEGRIPISLYIYQERLLKALVNHNYNIVLASRQIGKTTVLTIYTLWLVCFNADKRVLILANKKETALEIFNRIKFAYEQLPNYLKPCITKWQETQMNLDNGSTVKIASTSEDAFRGQSANVLLLDEFAHIQPHVAEAFFASVIPVISSSKNAKVCIFSTPNGVGNKFHEIWENSLNKKNRFHGERVEWHEVPGRDEDWKNNQISIMGKKLFDQEYGNEFLDSTEDIMDKDLLQGMKMDLKDLKFYEEDDEFSGKYRIFEAFQENHYYSIGIDVAEGLGRHYSALQIVDVTDLKDIRQAAVYTSNKIDVYNFATKIDTIARQWGTPPLCIESNNCGRIVIDSLMLNHGYMNIPSAGASAGSMKHNMPGIFAHTNSKINSVNNFRYYLSVRKSLKIFDIDTLNEFDTYVKVGQTWKKKRSDECSDDRLEALIWALYILSPDLCDRFYEIVERDDSGKPLKITPIGGWYIIPKDFRKMSLKDRKDLESMDFSEFNHSPFVFSRGGQGVFTGNDEMESLTGSGWRFV